MVFNNRFNNKDKDPLVEAAKGAMRDGELRRQAIAMVNEEFGVFNRNAVVRENLAAYDARIEEAYRCVKEGKPLTPAQKAKMDVDDDNDIDADDLSVLRARKKGKMNEKKGCYEGLTVEPRDVVDYSAPDRAAVTKDNKPVVSDTAPKADADVPTPPKRPANLQELKKPTAKTAMKAYYRAYDSDVQSGEGERSNRLSAWKQKHLPGKSARNQKSTGKAELPDYSEKDSGYTATVKKSGKLTKSTEKATKAEIKSRLGKHTAPHLPEETVNEVAPPGREKQVMKLKSKFPKGSGSPFAIAWSSYNKSKKGLKEEIVSIEEANEAYAAFVAEAINTFALAEHPEATVENLHMFNEAYIIACLDEAYACSDKKMKKHEKMKKDLEEAAEAFGKEKEEKGEKEEKAKKILAKLKESRSFKSALETGKTAINELSAFGQAFAAARREQGTGGKFSFGGKSYTTNIAGEKPATAPSAKPSPAASTAMNPSKPYTAPSSITAQEPKDTSARAALSPRGIRSQDVGTGAVSTKTTWISQPGMERSTTVPGNKPEPAPKPEPVTKAEPIAPSGVNTPNVSTPSAAPTAMTQTKPEPPVSPSVQTATPSGATPSSSSSAMSPLSTSDTTPSATKADTASEPTPSDAEKTSTKKAAPVDQTVATESKLNESVTVGGRQYRIV